MKTLIKITIIIFAIIGLVASGLGIRSMLETNRMESAYECNCQDVKIGMTKKEAEETMKKGLDINFRGYDYEVTFNDTPVDFYLAYSTNGGSFIATIHIDKETGLVTKTDCPPKADK